MPRLPELADLQNQAKDLAATPEPGQSGPAGYGGAATTFEQVTASCI